MNTHTPPAASQGTSTSATRDSPTQEVQEIAKKSLLAMQDQAGDSMGGGGGGGGGLNISDVLYLTDVDSEALCLDPLYQQ